MRTIATSPIGQLLLNGRVLYSGARWTRITTPSSSTRRSAMPSWTSSSPRRKHMGLNCLRTHIKITDPRYYDAADRAGMLIWTELPNWQDLTERGQAAGPRDAVRHGRAGLEPPFDRDLDHRQRELGRGPGGQREPPGLAGRHVHQLKALDPHRLVVGNSPCFTNFHVVTDIEDFHNYYAMPDHYRKWKDWVQTFASRPPWTFAHVYESIESWREYIRDPWNPLPAAASARSATRRGSEPMVVSEFGNWGLPDVAKAQGVLQR